MKTLDITGQRFGKLVALRWTGRVDAKRYRIWEFQCDCGALVERSAGYVKDTTNRGWPMSCGSLECSGHFTSRLPGHTGAFNRLYDAYRRSAQYRSLKFTLSKEEVWELFQSCCHYCGAKPARFARPHGKSHAPGFLYNGIDRLDNAQGYVPGNVVPCCKQCNYSKGTLSLKEFLEWVEQVHSHSISAQAPNGA